MGIRSCSVVIHDKIRYILDPSEMSFLIHLMHLKEMRACGCKTAYSHQFNMMSFQLSKDVFYRCAKKLDRLGLLDRKSVGVFTDYIFLEKGYSRLVEILNATNDVETLLSFSQREFIQNKRSIDQISDTEISEMKVKGDYYLKE